MLSKREWFAGQVMAGLAAQQGAVGLRAADVAIEAADALCKALQCNPAEPAFSDDHGPWYPEGQGR